MINIETSKKMHQEASLYLVDGVSSGIRKLSDPLLYFERADGPYFYDVDGNTFVDYALAWGPLILGSNHAGINKAVSEQLTKGYTFGAQHQLEIDLAKKMCDILPGVENVIFSNTGTEAVQAALRIARAKTGKNKIIKFEGHYHGWHNNVLVSYRQNDEQLGRTTATCGGQPTSEFADTLTLAWNDIDALTEALETYGHEIACVITEPLLANSGSCMPKDGYLEALIALCKQHEVVSIFDEVITGFRIALGGAREYFGIEPDLSVYAKAMAGGFTMSAVGGRKEMFDVLREGKTLHAGTYNGSLFNLAAAVATIHALSEPGTYERMHKIGYAIRASVEAGAQKLGLNVKTSGLGSVFSIHFQRDAVPESYRDMMGADTASYQQFKQCLLEQGILVLPDGRWYISAVHTDIELQKTLTAIEHALSTLSESSA